jgi:hypothetical protein
MRNGHVRGMEEKHILSCAFTPVKPEVADFVRILVLICNTRAFPHKQRFPAILKTVSIARFLRAHALLLTVHTLQSTCFSTTKLFRQVTWLLKRPPRPPKRPPSMSEGFSSLFLLYRKDEG